MEQHNQRLTAEDVQLINHLIEREIDNLIDVAQRTGRESWYTEVKRLREIQGHLEYLPNPNTISNL